MNRAELKVRAKGLLKPQFVTVLLALIVSQLLMGLLTSSPLVTLTRKVPTNIHAVTFTVSTSLSGTTLLGVIASLLLSGPLAVGAMHVCTTITAGGKARVEQLFDAFKTNFVSCFLAHLIGNLIIALYCLLLIIPGIMKAYSYAMVSYVLRQEPECSAMDALHRSQEMMHGHRMELFMLQLSFIGWYALCVLTLGLALIWVSPYEKMTETVFFDKIYGAAAN